MPADVKAQIAAATEEGIPIVTTEQAHQALLDAGLAPAEADAVTADYSNAQLDALQTSMLAVASSRCSRSGSRGGYPEGAEKPLSSMRRESNGVAQVELVMLLGPLLRRSSPAARARPSRSRRRS